MIICQHSVIRIEENILPNKQKKQPRGRGRALPSQRELLTRRPSYSDGSKKQGNHKINWYSFYTTRQHLTCIKFQNQQKEQICHKKFLPFVSFKPKAPNRSPNRIARKAIFLLTSSSQAWFWSGGCEGLYLFFFFMHFQNFVIKYFCVGVLSFLVTYKVLGCSILPQFLGVKSQSNHLFIRGNEIWKLNHPVVVIMPSESCILSVWLVVRHLLNQVLEDGVDAQQALSV